MSEHDEPTNPGTAPPPSFEEEEDQATKFARLVQVALEPIKADSAAVRDIARQVFDEFAKFRDEVRKDVVALQRRTTALEHWKDTVEERLGTMPPGDS